MAEYQDPDPEGVGANYERDEIIAARTFRLVAVRWHGGAFAVYARELPEYRDENGEESSHWPPSADNGDTDVAERGDKIDERAAKFTFFPDIRGRYDG